MQTKNLKKKGFTLVELVIVVAVIAVLSAILIPTIGCFVEQAKETNDMATVRLLNVALVEDEAENGKPATMTEALAAMNRKGYDIEKLNPRSTGEIFWDGLNNRFALYNKDGEPVYLDNSTAEPQKINLWKIVETEDENGNPINITLDEEYSHYLKGENYVADQLTVKTGLDVGNNTGIKAILYKGKTSAQNVVIRTNGGELTVNAPDDTVYHYGKSGKVVITAVAPASYHENGEVEGDIVIVKGRIELAASAKVGTVFVSSVATGDVKIDVVSGAKIGTVAPTTEAAKADVDASTSIPEESKHEGIVEANTNYAGGLGTERSPYLIATAEQFKNIKSGKSGAILYYTLVSNIDLSKVKYTKNQSWQYYISSRSYISLDGTYKNITLGENCAMAYSLAYSTVKNFEIKFATSLINDQAITRTSHDMVYENITTTGSLTMDGNGGLYGAQVYNEITLNNCINEANIISGANYDAVFLGRANDYNSNIFTFNNCINKGTMVSLRASMFVANNNSKGTLKIVINNCKNEGTIRSTSFTAVGGNSDYVINQYITMPGSNYEITVNGKLLSSIYEGSMMGFVQGPNDTKLALKENEDKTFTLIESDNSEVAYYIVKIGLYMKYAVGAGTEQYYLTEKIADTNEGSYTTQLKHFDFAQILGDDSSDVAGYKTTLINGKTYYYLNGVKGANNDVLCLSGDTQVVTQIMVQAYTSDGMLVSSATLSK